LRNADRTHFPFPLLRDYPYPQHILTPSDNPSANKMDFKSQYFEALGLDAHSYVLSIASFLLGAYLLIRLVREYVYRTRIGSSVRNKIEEDTEGEQAPELEQREHDVKIKLEPDLDHEHELKSIPKYYRIERWEDTTQSASASAERVIESKTVVPK